MSDGPFDVGGAPPGPPPPEDDATGGGGEGGGAGGGGGGDEGGGSTGADGGGTPWERRHEIGFASGLVETTRQVLATPGEFFRTMPRGGGIGSPLLYALIVSYIGLVAATLYNAVFNAVLGPTFANLGAGRPELERYAALLRGGPGTILANLILGPVVVVALLFVGAGLVHLMLLLVGGARHPFETTFRVMGYLHATSILNLVPIVGSLIGIAYWVVLAVIGLSAGHGISEGRAAFALFLQVFLVCCCCGLALGAVFFFGGVVSMMALSH
jgi:hypothetical protein